MLMYNHYVFTVEYTMNHTKNVYVIYGGSSYSLYKPSMYWLLSSE